MSLPATGNLVTDGFMVSTLSGAGESGVSSTLSGAGEVGVASTLSGAGESGVSSTLSGAGKVDAASTLSGAGKVGAATTSSGVGERGVASTLSGAGEGGVASTLKGGAAPKDDVSASITEAKTHPQSDVELVYSDLVPGDVEAVVTFMAVHFYPREPLVGLRSRRGQYIGVN